MTSYALDASIREEPSQEEAVAAVPAALEPQPRLSSARPSEAGEDPST